MLKVKPPEDILVVKRESKKHTYHETAFEFPAPEEAAAVAAAGSAARCSRSTIKTSSESDAEMDADDLIVDDCSVHSSVPKSRTSSILSVTIPAKPFTLTVTDTSLSVRTPVSEDDYWRYFQDASQLNFVVSGGRDTIIGRKDARLLLANYRGVDESMIDRDDRAIGHICGRTVKGLRDFISALGESGATGMRIIRELSVGSAKGRTKTLLIQIQQQRIEAHIRMHSTMDSTAGFGSLSNSVSEAEFADVDVDSGFTTEHLPDRSWSDEDLDELMGSRGGSPGARSHTAGSNHNVNRTRISIYDMDLEEEELKASEPGPGARFSGAGFGMLCVPPTSGSSSGSGSSSSASSSSTSAIKSSRRRGSRQRQSGGSRGMSLLSPIGRLSTFGGSLSHLRNLTYNLELWSCEEDDLDLGEDGVDIDDEYADVLCTVDSPPDSSPLLAFRDTDSSLMGGSGGSICEDDLSPGALISGHEPRKSTLSASAEIEFWDPTTSCLSTRSTGSSSSSEEIDFSVSRQLSVSVSDCLARMMHAPCGF